MSLHHRKAGLIENSIKSMSSRGNDVVKIDLVVTMLIDMQWISTLRDSRRGARIGESRIKPSP